MDEDHDREHDLAARIVDAFHGWTDDSDAMRRRWRELYADPDHGTVPSDDLLRRARIEWVAARLEEAYDRAIVGILTAMDAVDEAILEAGRRAGEDP